MTTTTTADEPERPDLEAMVADARDDIAAAADFWALETAHVEHTGPRSPLALAGRETATYPAPDRLIWAGYVGWARERVQHALTVRGRELAAEQPTPSDGTASRTPPVGGSLADEGSGGAEGPGSGAEAGDGRVWPALRYEFTDWEEVAPGEYRPRTVRRDGQVLSPLVDPLLHGPASTAAGDPGALTARLTRELAETRAEVERLREVLRPIAERPTAVSGFGNHAAHLNAARDAARAALRAEIGGVGE